MLDVHVPGDSPHGVRHFFIHLFTITIGLLIALTLESTVESIHHRHLRHQAEENIRQEIRENLAITERATPELESERREFVHMMVQFLRRSRNEPADIHGMGPRFVVQPLKNAAWRTALSTGALSYMPYDEVQLFSAAYKGQDLLEAASENAIRDYLKLGAQN